MGGGAARLASAVALFREARSEQRHVVLVFCGFCCFAGGVVFRVGGAGGVCCLSQQLVGVNGRVVGSVLRGELPASGAFRTATEWAHVENDEPSGRCRVEEVFRLSHPPGVSRFRAASAFPHLMAAFHRS